MFESAGSKELDPRALMEVWHLKTTLDLLKTDFRHTHSHTHTPLLMTDFWLGLVQLRLRPLRFFFFFRATDRVVWRTRLLFPDAEFLPFIF